MGAHLPLVALVRSPFAGWREKLMVAQFHSNYCEVSSIPNLLTEDIPAKAPWPTATPWTSSPRD
jgi:hypothetical protein